jgi:hypothetical protein
VTAFDVTAGGQTVTLIADADSGWLCRGVALETTLSDNLKNALTGLTLSTDAAGTPAAGAQTVVIAVYQDRTGWEQLDLTLTETDAGWLALLQRSEQQRLGRRRHGADQRRPGRHRQLFQHLGPDDGKLTPFSDRQKPGASLAEAPGFVCCGHRLLAPARPPRAMSSTEQSTSAQPSRLRPETA